MIIGGGFGGLRVARGLGDAPVQVVLVDRRNHHLFQPLLYQVATGLLPPGDIAPALRGVLADQRNARVVLGDATAVDAEGRGVEVTTADGARRRISYDHLVLATGATASYFGHDDWRTTAPPMKSLDDALTLRDRFLRAFEAASVTRGAERRAWMTFVVVGAGPTGVELAGQLSALARRTLRREFHDLDTDDVRIVLVDGGDSVLSPFAEPLREHTARQLADLGVDVQLGRRAAAVDEHGVTFEAPEGQEPERIDAQTVVWAAGVRPATLVDQVARALDTPTDRQGRLLTEPDCSLPGHPDVFAIGDTANVDDLPGIAEPAIQEGRYVARALRHRLGLGRDPGPFHYVDLGTMATISPLDAVADVRGLHLTGLAGKAAWAGVHIAFLVGWPNRLATLAHWAWTLSTGGRQHQVILRPRRATHGRGA